jgi:type III pantothenate kinase
VKTTAEFLLVDAGNTRVKWALAGRSGIIRPQGEMTTASATATKIGALARRHKVPHVILACVVPNLVPAFQRAFAKRLYHVTGKAVANLGLHFDYPKPQEIGADRLAAAVVAQEEGHWPAIVISCGTATAFTVLDGRGRLQGGAIAPGVRAQLAALSTAAAQLPDVALRAPRSPLARSTVEAMRSGVVHSFRGGVKEIVEQLTLALPTTLPPRLLLTGGDAALLADVAGLRAELRPLLVFEGLRIIGNRAFPGLP